MSETEEVDGTEEAEGQAEENNCEYCNDEPVEKQVEWYYRLGNDTHVAQLALCEECTKLFVHWDSELTFEVSDL